jgi:hypothetical protein
VPGAVQRNKVECGTSRAHQEASYYLHAIGPRVAPYKYSPVQDTAHRAGEMHGLQIVEQGTDAIVETFEARVGVGQGEMELYVW